MSNLLEELAEQPARCCECNKEAVNRSFIIKESKPYKVMSVTDCNECGHTETSQFDYEELDYGVRITCQFDHKGTYTHFGELCYNSNEDLNRMVFINNGAKVTIIKDDKVLFDFTCDTPNIDSVEGMMMRGEDIFRLARDDKNTQYLWEIANDLTAIINGAPFKLIIEDETGWSKLCPLGKEYADIQDIPIEEMGEENIKYEKIAKSN